MTPRGLIAYIAGVILLIGGIGLAMLMLLLAETLPRARPETGVLFLVSVVLIFAAVHLLSAGLYRMLVHLYHTV